MRRCYYSRRLTLPSTATQRGMGWLYTKKQPHTHRYKNYRICFSRSGYAPMCVYVCLGCYNYFSYAHNGILSPPPQQNDSYYLEQYGKLICHRVDTSSSTALGVMGPEKRDSNTKMITYPAYHSNSQLSYCSRRSFVFLRIFNSFPQIAQFAV